MTTECPWRDTLYWYDTIDSTNTRAKEMAKEGAPEGTVLIAGNQTGGRGRLGRSFSSPEGMGVYLSAILQPDCKAEQLMHLTCAAGVAACKAVEKAGGIYPGIKWINDLVCGKEKVGKQRQISLPNCRIWPHPYAYRPEMPAPLPFWPRILPRRFTK